VVFCGVTPCGRAGFYPDFGGTLCLKCSFRGVKRPGPEFDHSPPFSAAMKNDIPIPLLISYLPSCRRQGQIYLRLFIVVVDVVVVIIIIIIIVIIVPNVESQRPRASLSNITFISNHLVDCFIL